MKRSSTHYFAAVALCFFLTGLSIRSHAQNKTLPELRPFLVLVETTDNGFRLACWKGCAWKELEFAVNPYQPQAVDALGITTLAKHDTPAADQSLAGFLFTVTKTEKGVIMKGIEGTGWKEYLFDSPGKPERDFVTEYGTARLD